MQKVIIKHKTTLKHSNDVTFSNLILLIVTAKKKQQMYFKKTISMNLNIGLKSKLNQLNEVKYIKLCIVIINYWQVNMVQCT